jgi:aspartate aminotransferase-like enzyme
MMSEDILRSGSDPLPYFRTEAFSRTLLDCEALLLRLLNAPVGHRVVFLTASGTAAMEAALSGFGADDAILVINAGAFGERFVELCRFHGLPHSELVVAPGGPLSLDSKGPLTAVVACHHETTTGTLYNLAALDAFCRAKNALLVLDAISSFLADPIDLSRHSVDALIVSSQKGLALPPGLSMVVLSPRMIRKLEGRPARSYYLDLNRHLKDGARGQTPFTPAIGIVRQLEKRLQNLVKKGAAAQVERTALLAQDFRKKIRGLPFALFSSNPSNALTALEPSSENARSALWYVERLREDFGFYVCPNGGVLKDRVFRVGHLGDLTVRDNTLLVAALKKLAAIKSSRTLAA